jgi:homoserine O-acetyltransferase/O-succinyltransferase
MQDVVELAKSVFMAQDANDLLAMAATWRAGNPSANPVYNGDFEKALRSVTARGLVMPCVSDLYFRVSDNQREVALLGNAELAPIQSDFGHLAGAGLDPSAITFINDKLSSLLAS